MKTLILIVFTVVTVGSILAWVLHSMWISPKREQVMNSLQTRATQSLSHSCGVISSREMAENFPVDQAAVQVLVRCGFSNTFWVYADSPIREVRYSMKLNTFYLLTGAAAKSNQVYLVEMRRISNVAVKEVKGFQ